MRLRFSSDMRDSLLATVWQHTVAPGVPLQPSGSRQAAPQEEREITHSRHCEFGIYGV